MPAVLLRNDHRHGATAVRSVRRFASCFLESLGLHEAEVSIVLTTDRRIRRVNREWRSMDEPTDVLSFPAAEGPRLPGHGRPLGDVMISLDTARRRAKAERRPLGAELARYLAHGLLHLIGFDHATPREARRMARAEAKLLGAAGMVACPGPEGPLRRAPS